MNDTLYKKLKIIKTLFGTCISDINNNLIDYESRNGYTRAWIIAEDYISCFDTLDYSNGLKNPTKNDLKYINTVIINLVSIIGIDETILSKKYIESKLTKIPSDIHQWIIAYKQLIELIK